MRLRDRRGQKRKKKKMVLRNKVTRNTSHIEEIMQKDK